MAKKQLFNYSFVPGVNQTFNAFPNAVELLLKNKEYIRKNLVGFIANQVANNVAPFQNYTYNEKKCERDAGYVLDAIVEDVRYNGNVNTRQISQFYWVGNVPQIDGSRTPEIAAYNYVRTLINTYIFTNTTVTPVYQTEIPQTKIVGFNAEAGASTRITVLTSILNDVIENGLTSVPAEVAGSGKKGKLTLEGNIDAKKLLLISNQTKGKIIYTFSDEVKLLKAIYQQQPINKTTITLFADTTEMNASDKLQIFYEDDNQYIKPHPTYQDPVEKMRVSNPQSMMDTDFEYSLQGTKWETLELINNIPSVYSKANEPAFTSTQITSIAPAGGGQASAAISSLAYAPNGTSGLSTIIDFGGGFSDDSNFIVNLPFSIQYLGQAYNSVFVGTNGYITFGQGSSIYFSWAGNFPNTPHLLVVPGDRTLIRLYAGQVGNKYIIRAEGGNCCGGAQVYTVEYHFQNNSNVIDIHIPLAPGSGAVTTPAVGDGVNFAYVAQGGGFPTSNTAFRVITSAGASRDLLLTVNTSPPTPFFVGQPIVIKESTNNFVDGSYLIKAVPNSFAARFTAKANIQAGATYNNQYTTVYTGGFFTGAEIPITSINNVNGTTNAQINFVSPHGLFPGQALYVVDNSTTAADWVGSFTVVSIPSSTSVIYQTDAVVLNSNTNTISSGNTRVYVRSEAVGLHRFVDGGVQIKPGSPAPNTQIIRQTRKYFRYQSGKGVQFSTGILFSPTYEIQSLSVTTNVFDAVNYPFYNLNITLEAEHGFSQPDEYREGALLEITGLVAASGPDLYNGLYNVLQVSGPRSFVINIDPTITDLSPGGLGKVAVVRYRDAVVRDGMFDDQNGLFYEYDGQYLYCVKRSSTQQVTGQIAVTQGSSTVTGTNTKFLTQLSVGQLIVIKGATYRVTQISNNTAMIVQPDIRTVTESGIRFNRVEDLRTAIFDFNIDPLDGSGPSGFVFNPTRMQMIFIDYSWYGAGKARFGMRGLDGSIIYCHEIVNNNVNTEAYMRSGNLPGRFEINTASKLGILTSTLTTSSTTFTMSNRDAEYFPAKGRVVINYETIRYIKGIQVGNNTTFNIQLRNESGRTTNATAVPGDTVWSFNQNCGPALSHWGVSVMMDGRFDEDKSYLFTGQSRGNINVGVGQTAAVVSIRLAPSVDNSIGREFGIRNLVNRSAIILKEIGIITNGVFEITVRINGESPLFSVTNNWFVVGNGSISQYLDHSIFGSTPPIAGDSVTTFFTEEGASRFAITERDIDQVRELGNSILGGNNVYPDGPDILTITARNIGAQTYNIRARISWAESQG
jgi:hypothetical protein